MLLSLTVALAADVPFAASVPFFEVAIPDDVSTLGDLDLDGIVDLGVVDRFRVRRRTSPGAKVWLSTGTTNQPHVWLSRQVYWNDIAGGDLNGDGASDIVASANVPGGAVHVWFGPFAPGRLLPQSGDAVVRFNNRFSDIGRFVNVVDDVDGDGRAELAFDFEDGAVFERSVSIIPGAFVNPGAALNDADVAWTLRNDVYYSAQSVISIGDFNGDGIGDLATDGSDILVFSGATLLASPTPSPVYFRYRTTQKTDGLSGGFDLDGDGMTELLWEDDGLLRMVYGHRPGAPHELSWASPLPNVPFAAVGYVGDLLGNGQRWAAAYVRQNQLLALELPLARPPAGPQPGAFPHRAVGNAQNSAIETTCADCPEVRVVSSDLDGNGDPEMIVALNLQQAGPSLCSF